MSKYVNITVSASLSTDFFIEVPDDFTEEQIKEVAKKQVILPHTYPKVLDNFLRTRMNLNIKGLDSMLKDWDLDELTFIVENDK